MIGLTDRLTTLAQQINKGETMADIGTDHGFLPIYLMEHQISPRVIMTDISEKALSRAKHHGESIDGINPADYRIGNGMEVLSPGEVDNIVIAGMGGILMTEILDYDLEKTRSFNKFVFQPRNHPEVLRIWLAEHGFDYLNEILVKEGKNICEIIVASPNRPGCITASRCEPAQLGWPPKWPQQDFRWEVPPWYQEMNLHLAEEYLRRKQEKQQRILWAYGEGSHPDPDHIAQLKGRIAYLEELIENRGRVK